VVSATHPSFQTSPSLKSSAKVDKKNIIAKYRAVIFFENTSMVVSTIIVLAMSQRNTSKVFVIVLILNCRLFCGRINKRHKFTYFIK
ncbi:MAG: hypothetical protein IKD24_08685, partial [Alistipes sp.]|nr:hypothetical protein [Alistipes sp.]